MPILPIILTLAAVGVVLWLINAYLPMEAGIKKLLNIAVIVVMVIWLLRVTGLFAYLASVRV